MPDPEPRPIDPLVDHVIEAWRANAESQDRRHGELLDAWKAQNETQAARDAKRDEQHTELVKAMGALTERMGGLAGEVKVLAGKAPGPRSLWALGGGALLLILVLIGLYAQANGDDAGKAIDDARRAIPVDIAEPPRVGMTGGDAPHHGGPQ